MLLHPFEDLYAEAQSLYTLQLSCYQIPLEDIGLKVIGRRLIHLKEDGTYEKIPLPDVTKELRNTFFSNVPDDGSKAKQNIKKQILLALCSLFDFIAFNLLSLGCGSENPEEGNALNQELRNSKIILLCLFSKVILKSSFYKHHIVLLLQFYLKLALIPA